MGNSESCYVFTPSTIVSGLQAELQAAYKEGECVKKKLKLQEAELETMRKKFSEKEDGLNSKYSMFWIPILIFIFQKIVSSL